MNLPIREEETKTCSELPTVFVARRSYASARNFVSETGMQIFVGPIKDNTGKEVVTAGDVYGPYADELQHTDCLIDGVVGSIT
jgi:hypothetical protein